MENAELRPSLPWRRVMPGTYAAETPTGETYLVERTEDGWRVVLRGPRGGREVLGEPSRIKWVGQCRAENHYLQALKAKGGSAAAPEAEPKRKSQPSTSSAKAASAPGRKKRSEMQGSRRHRRAPPAQPKQAEKPSKPARPAASVEPLPAHTLAWQVSQQNGREFHVAEHDGGLFKIIEVKGAEGFALFSERTGGVVQEIRCGSLDACKELAASMGKSKRKARVAAQGKGDKSKPEAHEEAKPSAKAKAADKARPVDKAKSSKASEVKPPAESGACGCDPPPPKARAPLDEAKQAKLVDGLRSALRKVKPPTVEA